MFRAARSCTRCHRVLGLIPETSLSRRIYIRQLNINRILCRPKTDDSHLSTLFTPVPVKSNPDDINVGAELTGQLNKNDLIKIINAFYQNKEIKILAAEQGLDNYLLHQAYTNFRKHCLEVKNLEVDLHIALSDVLQGAGHVSDIFPYFLRFAKKMFPHLECMDDLRKISDLRSPPNWYPAARAKCRKIIFHAGPTNSGKTYRALERFLQSKSGVYCGPLKLLATEVFRKANDRGTPCDLVTGEERKYAISENEPASHVSCTVEMTSLLQNYEVAVIDEIQMIKDPTRGWAWTRALLGLVADEIHVCGEEGAVDLIRNLMLTTNEDVDVCKYKRLTELHIEDSAVCSLDNIRNGDCVVCFSKNDVYSVSRGIEGSGKEVAVIYGGLPPNTKLAQAQKFNDPESSCNVLVATDAIGMGLNLSIRRVIFYSLIKPVVNEKGEKEMDTISVSQALQIAGRAGRFNTQYEKGYVTTFKAEDLKTLKHLLTQRPDPLTKAGIHPTAEQIELYAYHLPHSTLSNLMDIFVTLSTVDEELYFMCGIEDFKFLADMLQHVPLSLRARYTFCCAPLNRRMAFVCSMFLKFAKQYSNNEPITFDWVSHHIGWPLSLPKTILELVHLESVFDVLDLYLWFSYRFPDIFIEPNPIRDIQSELDALIQQGVLQITRLLQNSDKAISVNIEEDYSALQKKPEQPAIGKGRLADRLIAQGLLTPNMLKELQNEWAEGETGKPNHCNSRISIKEKSKQSTKNYENNTMKHNDHKPPYRVTRKKRK
ncbi:ATP-dependent RNA helicase SUV3 homolog, mitochondrial [Planococcus citri]|uniref:ATP-dependent RNA helicase SUV3 homolog, mitochondrial n=1 Tax=Planococcus citri TaxID=170843 RepID=UPI0031F816AA